MRRVRPALVWLALLAAVTVPIVAATQSPLLAWRSPVYIAAGIAGVVGLALLLVQPLLAAGYLPGLSRGRARRVHRWTGGALVTAVVVHVAGLWITSPPDVIDVLLFRSPTPFSVWGAIAMWSVFAAALVTAFRHRIRLRPHVWRLGHRMLVTIAVATSAAHALLIEGTMETISKIILCGLAVFATAAAVLARR